MTIPIPLPQAVIASSLVDAKKLFKNCPNGQLELFGIFCHSVSFQDNVICFISHDHLVSFQHSGTWKWKFQPSRHLSTRVSKGWDVPLSLCPGTRAGAKIPGQNHLPKKKTPKTGKGHSKTRKGRSKTGKDVLKQEIWSFFLKIFSAIR